MDRLKTCCVCGAAAVTTGRGLADLHMGECFVTRFGYCEKHRKQKERYERAADRYESRGALWIFMHPMFVASMLVILAGICAAAFL